MVPADVVDAFIRFAISSVTELPTTLTAIRAVHRNWNIYVFKTAAKLLFTLPYDWRLVANRLGYVPPTSRVRRILRIASRDFYRSYPESEQENFEGFVNAQILLQYMRAQADLYDVYVGEALNLFTNVVAGVLNENHPLVHEAVTESLDLQMNYHNFLNINISDEIHCIHRTWRSVAEGPFTLLVLVEMLHRSYILRGLGIFFP